MREDWEQPLTPNEALDVLDRFSDKRRGLMERFDALNDARVNDTLVTGFLNTLEPDARLEALAVCHRSTVLATWADVGNAVDRQCIAGNPWVDVATLHRLAADTEDAVRSQVPFNPSADLDVVAWLLGDPSAQVQRALQVMFEEESSQPRVEAEEADELPGDDEGLTFLYEMVASAEELDCLEGWQEAKRRECAEALVRETEQADGCAPDLATLDSSEDADEAWHLSTSQVLGLLHHILGTLVVEHAHGPAFGRTAA